MNAPADAVDADLLVHGSLSTTLTDAGDSAPVVSLTLLNARALVVVNRVTAPRDDTKPVAKRLARLPKGLHQVGGRHTIGNNECQVEIARWIFAHHLRRLWLWNFVQHDRKVHFQTGNAPNYSGISQHRWINLTN